MLDKESLEAQALDIMIKSAKVEDAFSNILFMGEAAAENPDEFKLEVNESQKIALTTLLNIELRRVSGKCADDLNGVFVQLVGRNHDVYARMNGLDCIDPASRPQISYVSFNQSQKDNLTILLNIELRQRGLAYQYADTLNDMFKQLVGRDHDVYADVRRMRQVD